MTKLLCRVSGENAAAQVAETSLAIETRGPMALVQILRSRDTGARGGMVIVLRNPDVDYVPCARPLPDGVEIHVAGEAEAQALLTALASAIRQLSQC